MSERGNTKSHDDHPGGGDPAPDGWRIEHLDAVPHVWLELVEGSIHLLPTPTAEHQALVRALAMMLSATTAQVQAQPDVVLDSRTRLRPDLVVVNEPAIQPVGSAIRLVIEVSEHTTQLVYRTLRPALWCDVGRLTSVGSSSIRWSGCGSSSPICSPEASPPWSSTGEPHLRS
ncbi:MAG: Uma2 family endonuclease [Mycobacteriales bacterium]